MKRITTTLLVIVIAAAAMAVASMEKVFESNYKVAKTSELGKATCLVCHASKRGGKLNPYGKDMAAAMKKANSKTLTPAILKSIEGLDSNKNGKSNLDDIKADKLPG